MEKTGRDRLVQTHPCLPRVDYFPLQGVRSKVIDLLVFLGLSILLCPVPFICKFVTNWFHRHRNKPSLIFYTEILSQVTLRDPLYLVYIETQFVI